ncbi:bifunctional transcriptional activator/DNA repair enzyme AdaA [Pseudaestuariivita rosea]|uniref:bifunctional transcriptional activator/DNA repair enzyme AdaA n=1 Tax=Pseudaestuariivita rosea TaxID=2763263 RepID=UPI001ABAD581|nr:trifunctional transcriptional activator/DNA repair protein Ada/methylated-DNA--[protein]-cysteine S-methyltransferase [Pseudaestuariivita rosea]
MLFTLPDHDTLYHALVTRDDAFDGRVFVGVTSTGIFCRLSCPARNPKPENCVFYETVADCMQAGFRPCKRCQPLNFMAGGDEVMLTLVKALAADPQRRWTEDDIIRMGFDPSTVRRNFKRQFGVTFLEMARLNRLRVSFETLAGGGSVVDAQLDAGFESPSAFRAAFTKIIGQAPGHFVDDAVLKADWIETPLGSMVVISDAKAIHLLEFVDRKALPAELKKLAKMCSGRIGFGRYAVVDQLEQQLAAYHAGQSARFTVPLVFHGTGFEKKVWRALCAIPEGETRSYGELARIIGQPTATRAVARANGANQLALVVPCHRVVGADGSLTGYGGGLWRKRQLIEIERQFTQDLQKRA